MDLSNPIEVTSLLNTLNYSTNCTTTLAWYHEHALESYWNNTDVDGRPVGFQYGQYQNDSTNLDFLKAALQTTQYQDAQSFDIIWQQMAKTWKDGYGKLRYETRSFHYLSYEVAIPEPAYTINISWYDRAMWHAFSDCITPQLLTIDINDLSETTNCTAAAIFFNNLDNSLVTIHDTNSLYYGHPVYSAVEVDFWKKLLIPHNEHLKNVSSIPRASPTVSDFTNEAVTKWYSQLFRNGSSVPDFAQRTFTACRESICSEAGFTGNSDIMGIGVVFAYILQTAIVSLTFAYCALIGPPTVNCPERENCQQCRADNLVKVYIADYTNWIANLLEVSIFFFAAICAARLYLDIRPQRMSAFEEYGSSMVLPVAFFNVTTMWILFDVATKSRGVPGIIGAIIDRKTLAIYLAYLASFGMMFFILMEGIDKRIKKDIPRVWGRDKACLGLGLSLQKGPSGKFYADNADFGILIMVAFALVLTLFARISFSASHQRSYLSAIFSALLTLAILWTPVYLSLNLRSAMKAVSGRTWGDSDFGFGQIVAIITWIPAGIDTIVGLTMQILRNLPPRLRLGHNESSRSRSQSPEMTGAPLGIGRAATM